MAISFNNIPSDVRVPLFYAEMDNSAANSASAGMRRLIVAQVNDDVTGPEIGSLVLVPSVALAKNLGGQGSMLAAMYETWRKADPTGEVWCLPLLNTEGAKAGATVTVAGAATETGLLNLYVGGVRVQATVVNGATAAQAANALSVKINATPDLPVRSVVDAGVLTLSCKWSGVSGNDIRLEFNRLGKTNGEAIPAGLTAEVTVMTGGVGTLTRFRRWLLWAMSLSSSCVCHGPTPARWMPGKRPWTTAPVAGAGRVNCTVMSTAPSVARSVRWSPQVNCATISTSPFRVSRWQRHSRSGCKRLHWLHAPQCSFPPTPAVRPRAAPCPVWTLHRPASVSR